jgi:3',5'-cyclic AMP phosphodiesterase CpdA
MVAADATEPPARAALNVGGYKLYWKDLPNSFARLEETAAFLNGTVKADFLIHTGDITDLGRLEDLRRAQKIMASLKRPFFALMGNDDMGEPQAEFEKHRGDSNFVKTFGALNTVFDYSGWRFILLSAFPGDADMEWLRRQLDGSAGRPTVLCTHPLVIADNLTQVMSAYYGGSLLMARADEVEAMIREHPNVVAVLSGHCHCTFHWTRHGTEYFTTAALVGLPATVRVFSVYKGRMEVATWTADSVQDMQAGKWKKANSERIEYRTEN